MGVERRICFVVRCDNGCDDDQAWDDDLGPPHWTSREAALKDVPGMGWLVLKAPDGRVRVECPRCFSGRACQQFGHEWGEWCAHAQPVPHRTRYCERDQCPEVEYDPPWEQIMVLVDAAKAVEGG